MTKLLSWWQRFLNRAISKRVLMAASLAWMAVSLLPLILISFDAHPTHDDFVHTLPVVEVWIRTGSLWQTLLAAFERTAEVYNTWQGTFVAMLLSAFQPMVFSPKLFFVTPILTLAGLYLAGAYFCKALIHRTLGAEPSVWVITYALLMTLLLQFLPSPRELIYWHSGTPYVWSVTMILWMLGLGLRLRESGSALRQGLRVVCLLIAGVILGGCPYPVGLGSVVGFGLLCCLCFAHHRKERWGSLVAFVSVAVAFGLVLLAPGNSVRQEVVNAEMESAALSPVMAVAQSIFKAMVTVGGWLPLQLVGVGLILLPLLLPTLKQSKLRFKHPIWFSFFSFGVLAAAFVPPIYATGLEGYQVERVLSSLYMLYVVLLLGNAIYWIGFMAKKPSNFVRMLEGDQEGRISLWQVGLCVGVLLWALCTHAVTTTFGISVAAGKSLLTGEAARYHQEMLRREEAIEDSKNREEAVASVRELSGVPAVFPRDKLPYRQAGGLGMIPVMYKYYRMQGLAEEYGAGHVPEEKWQALEAWLNDEGK